MARPTGHVEGSISPSITRLAGTQLCRTTGESHRAACRRQFARAAGRPPAAGSGASLEGDPSHAVPPSPPKSAKVEWNLNHHYLPFRILEF
jgi:hypothetical protein